MKGNVLWHIGRAVARRAIPLLLGALTGVLLDAGLLDGELGQELLRLLGR